MIWTIEYIISQIFVVMAMGCLAGTYLIKNKKVILILSCLNAICFACSYLLLGAYSGVVINAVGIIRGVWFFINESKGKTQDYVSLIVCSILMLIGCVMTYKMVADIIVLFAGTLFTYSIWQKNISFYRWAAVVGSGCFITFNILINSIMGIVSESILIVIEIVGLVKWYVKDKKAVSDVDNNKIGLN